MRRFFIVPLALVLTVCLSGCFNPINLILNRKKPDTSTQSATSQVESVETAEKQEQTASQTETASEPIVSKVIVPNVVNVISTTANQKLRNASLLPKIEYTYDDNVPKNYVVKTVPAANESVNKDSTVVVYVSKGKAGLNKKVTCNTDGMMAGEITFSPDFKFTLTVNLYEGFGTIKGTYTILSNGSVDCTVTSRDFSGFTGDTVNSFTFFPLADGSYRLRINDGDYLGALMQNYIFS